MIEKRATHRKAVNVKNRISISVSISISKATRSAKRGKFKLYFIEIVPVRCLAQSLPSIHSCDSLRKKLMALRWNGQISGFGQAKERKYLKNFLMRFVWLSMPALNSQTTRKSSGHIRCYRNLEQCKFRLINKQHEKHISVTSKWIRSLPSKWQLIMNACLLTIRLSYSLTVLANKPKKAGIIWSAQLHCCCVQFHEGHIWTRHWV